MRGMSKVLLMTAMGLGAACGEDDTGTTTDAGEIASEVASEVVSEVVSEVASEVVTEVASEVVTDGTVPSDAPDAPTDTTPDANEETAPGETSACEPLSCMLSCANGFRHDAAGCDVCACRECDAPSDCAAVIDCEDPVCSDEGTCRCDCEGVSPEAYACPDGDTEVPFCACAARGWSCMEHPEYQCPTLCSRQEADAWPCPDGTSVPWCGCEVPSCQPVCQHVGEPSEGWYDGCSGALVRVGGGRPARVRPSSTWSISRPAPDPSISPPWLAPATTGRICRIWARSPGTSGWLLGRSLSRFVSSSKRSWARANRNAGSGASSAALAGARAG